MVHGRSLPEGIVNYEQQKLIGALQSRISKRKWFINRVVYKTASRAMRAYVKGLAIQQKQDKQILKQLIRDERELKWLRELLIEGMPCGDK